MALLLQSGSTVLVQSADDLLLQGDLEPAGINTGAKRWAMLRHANLHTSHLIAPTGSGADTKVERFTLLGFYFPTVGALAGIDAVAAFVSNAAAVFGIAYAGTGSIPTTPTVARSGETDLQLGNVPLIRDPEIHEAVLIVQNAVEILQGAQDDTNATVDARLTVLEP